MSTHCYPITRSVHEADGVSVGSVQPRAQSRTDGQAVSASVVD